MLVWVVASLTQESHEVLQLLDLVQVVNESLADLLNEQRSVRYLVLDFLLGAIIALRVLAHFLSSKGLGKLASALERGLVAD